MRGQLQFLEGFSEASKTFIKYFVDLLSGEEIETHPP